VSRQAQGLRAWLVQRFSALYLAAFVVYLVIFFLTRGGLDYAGWRAWLSHPAMAIAGAGFVMALVLHGWIGVRDVILDYIPALGARLLLLTLSGLLLGASGLWALRLLLLASG
jgi:succinate dehydrogenase / fumarate reductase membrane anchor subunit